MRMLLQAKMPLAKFNASVKDGTAGPKLKRILETTKPEAVYFTEWDGCRCAILIVNLEDASKVPSLAEPWFLTFDAEVHLRAIMSPEDLGRAGLEELGKTWS